MSTKTKIIHKSLKDDTYFEGVEDTLELLKTEGVGQKSIQQMVTEIRKYKGVENGES